VPLIGTRNTIDLESI